MKITPIIQYVQKLLKAVKTFYARFQLCFNLEFLSLMTKWFVYQKEFIVFLTSQVNCLTIYILYRYFYWSGYLSGKSDLLHPRQLVWAPMRAELSDITCKNMTWQDPSCCSQASKLSIWEMSVYFVGLYRMKRYLCKPTNLT